MNLEISVANLMNLIVSHESQNIIITQSQHNDNITQSQS